ncbi:MAG: hypothetical protein ACYCST_10685 [Acidimicrobiales bacterium]
MTSAIDAALHAFRATLVQRGAVAGAAATARLRWAGELPCSCRARPPGWTTWVPCSTCDSQTMELLGVATRQAVYDLAARHRLLGLARHGGGMAFPAFQFDPSTGRRYDAAPAGSVLYRVHRVRCSAWTCCTAWPAARPGRSAGSATGAPELRRPWPWQHRQRHLVRGRRAAGPGTRL